MATLHDMELERKVTIYEKGYDAPAGLRVVRVLDALQRSLDASRRTSRAAAG
jgi:hypothetical protein